MELRYIDIDLLKPESHSLMKDMVVTELDRYAVRVDGLRYPAMCYPNPNTNQHEQYLIFSGLKTWLLAQESEFQISQIPVIIQDKCNSENTPMITRGQGDTGQAPLNVVDEAKILQSVLDSDPTLSIAALARQLGRKRSDLSNQLRLLKLPIEIRNWIKQGKLAPGAGRALITMDDETQQITLAKDVMEKQMSLRVLEKRIRSLKHRTPTIKPKRAIQPQSSDPSTRRLENILSEKLGSTVRVSEGKLVIDYYSDLEVLQGLLVKLHLIKEAVSKN